ncbi:MAG: hypothetical protein PHH85_09020 [Candidatus Methanoperedens sp.]|nr:hypothetical protein [Candidatus Methanoperedens sp.]
MKDETIEERIKRIDAIDVTNKSFADLKALNSEINADLKFIEYKKRYYTQLVYDLRGVRNRLIPKIQAAKELCEICHNPIKVKPQDSFRTMPDGRIVCKHCWIQEICNARLKNANNIMKASP